MPTDKREQTCCFTGHRQLPPEQLPAIRKRIEAAVIELIGKGVCYFGAGAEIAFRNALSELEPFFKEIISTEENGCLVIRANTDLFELVGFTEPFGTQT